MSTRVPHGASRRRPIASACSLVGPRGSTATVDAAPEALDPLDGAPLDGAPLDALDAAASATGAGGREAHAAAAPRKSVATREPVRTTVGRSSVRFDARWLGGCGLPTGQALAARLTTLL